MTTTLTRPQATEPQISFINSLLSKRAVDEGHSAYIKSRLADLSSFSKVEASLAITGLQGYPVREAPVDAMSVLGLLREAYAALPHTNGKFALPTAELVGLTTTRVNSDHLFVEVKTYMGRTRLVRLTGAPGSFNRSRLSNDDALLIVRTIARDSLRYTQLFGELYNCCGKCGAELTDDVSRALKIGPTCRKYWHL